MKQNIHEIYTWTLKKYQKYHSRYLSGIQTGRFYNLSSKKRHQIVSRLEKLARRLKRLKLQLKVAIATGAISLCLHATPAKAQQLGPFVQNDEANPFFRSTIFDDDVKVSFGDLDNDGDLDMILGNRIGNIRYFENLGSASTPRLFERTGASNPFDGIIANYGNAAPLLVDFDSDGDLDLLLGERGSYSSFNDLRYFENSDSDDSQIGNDPSFTEITGASSPTNGVNGGYYDVKPTVVDIDNDGDLDILLGHDMGYPNGRAFSFFRNNGGFSYENPYSVFPNLPTYTYGDQNVAPTFHDFDGDGDFDLFIGQSNGSIRFFENTGNATNPSLTERTGVNNPLDGVDVGSNAVLTFVDIDDDGDKDLAIGANFGIDFFQNDGAGNLIQQFGLDNPFQRFDLGEDAFPTFADIDGDNNLDAIIGEKFSQTLYYFRNNGDGTVTEQQGATANPFDNIISIPTYSFDSPTPELNDIDNDGDLDLFIGIYYGSTLPYPGQVLFYQNDGSNNFSSAASPISDLNYNVLSPSFGDLDNDGDLDVALGARNGYVRFSRNQDIEDDGTLTQAVPNFIDETGTSNPLDEIDAGYSYFGKIKPKLIDLDHDGDLDLVAGSHGYSSNPLSGTIRFFSNDGSDNFTEQISTQNPFNGFDVGYDSSPAMVDWDGDGDIDLFVGNSLGRVVYFENQNEAPQTSGDPTPIEFVEGDAALVIDASLTISDDTNDDIISATISIVNDYVQGEDFIDVSLEGGASGSFDASTGTYTINGTATLAEYQNMLRSATYNNTNIDNPTPNARSVEFAVTDFDATNPGSDSLPEFQKTITITPVNDPPEVLSESTGDQAYEQNTTPVVVDNLIVTFDVDNEELVGAEIEIVDFEDGDELLFDSQNGITGSFSNGTLILSGNAAVEDYQTALSTVAFRTSNGAGTRDISFVVNDGMAFSQPYLRTINISNSTNQPPAVNTSPQTTQQGSVLTFDWCAIIDDPDNEDSELTVTVVSTLSDAETSIDGCDVVVDYSNSTFSGNDEIVLQACDPSGACDDNTINVTVNNENPPVNIYNAVSPNGDGLNDLWEVIGLTIPNSLELFNRWGDSVKSFSDVDLIAELDLSDLPAGTYFYKINSPEGEFKGYIVIKK